MNVLNLTVCCIFYCWHRQQIRIQQLSDENSSLQERLKTADDTIERQMKQIENLTLQLGEAERTLAEKEEDMESLDKASKDEVYKHCICIFCRNLHNFYLKRACCMHVHGRNTRLSLKALTCHIMFVCFCNKFTLILFQCHLMNEQLKSFLGFYLAVFFSCLKTSC